MHGRSVGLATAMLLAAFFPAAASACTFPGEGPERPGPIFWDAPPAAEEGEVVLKVRFVRTEPEKPNWPGGSCHSDPYIFVLEVMEVTEGQFIPTQIFLADTGGPQTRDRTAWLVGKPATLYTKHVFRPKTADPAAAELPSIVWRTPTCSPDWHCYSPNLRLFQP